MTSHRVDDFKDAVKRDAEELLLKKFPKKVLEVDKLLKSGKFQLLNLPFPKDTEESDNHSPKKKSRPNQEECVIGDQNPVISGVINGNKYLQELVSIVRPLMLEFIDDILSLKIGISLMIPKIEDGNNFGVEIQQETLETIIAAEEDMHSRLTHTCTYYAERAELVAKVIKSQTIEDYRIAVEERDQSFYVFLCVTLVLIRNYYTNLHDLVLKNLNKIKKPKSARNEEMLY